MEISARPVLGIPLERLVGAQGVVLGSLRRDAGELATMNAGLGSLHAHGVPVDWARLHGRGAPVGQRRSPRAA